MKRNMLRQGAAIVMAVLLAMPALPVRAEARKGMAAAAGAEAGYAVEAVSVMEGARNTAELAFAALADEIVGGINPETAVDGDDDAGTEEPVSGGDAGMYGMKSGVAGAAAATGTIGQPDANGDVLSWSYDDSTQTLTVTGSGVTQGGELSGAPFDGMGIKKIVFQDCKVAGSMAGFFKGLGVEEIDLSGADTGSVAYMQNMFSDCSSLTRLELGNFDTSSVEYMDYMFSGCSSLTGLELGSFDTSSVTNMERMFSDCSSLTRLELGNFDTSSVTNMNGMFIFCESLTGLELGSFDTSSVTNMGHMFYACKSLTRLELGNFDTSSVANMKYMFFFCNSLTGLELGSFDTSSVADMQFMFASCSSLTRLELGSFDTSSVRSMRGMFQLCNSLTGLELGNFDTSSVADMSGMFGSCSSLTRLELGNFDTSSVEYMDFMFASCSSLTGLELGSFDTSSVTDMEGMFYGCSSLTGLELGSFDTSSVTDMERMFSGCSSLTGLELGNFDTSSVRNMQDMFSGCSSLSTLYTPYNVRVSAALPTVSNAVWHLPDGTEVTELPQNLSTSVLLILTPVITITTETLNMPDVIRVKYVPYSYTVQTDNTDPDNQVTFSVVEGRLAEGLQMYPATGEIYGIPIESGEFKIKVEAAYSNPKYPPSYAELTLTVLENTDENVGTASDPGYRIIQAVPDLNMGSLSGPGTQLLVSEGEYAEFQDAVYLDGRRLQSGTEYTSEAGSTRITIQNQTLANAGTGSHTLSMEFRTQDTGALRRAAQNLTISAGEDTGSGDNTGNGGNEGNGGNTDNGGNTEDNTNNGGNGGTTDNTENNSGTNNGSGSSGSSGGSDVGWEENGTGGRTEPTVIDYIVQPGDNLWKISAKFFGDGSHWRQIYTDNTNIIRNPNILRTGWRLKIYLTAGNGLTGAASTPGAASPFNGSSYVVQQGDNLWKIAGEIYGKTGRWRDIYEANRSVLANPERIYAKQVLMIPR